MGKISFFRGLSFRIISLNIMAFLIIFLGFSYYLDRSQKNYLLDRTDRDLETEILVITSELDRIGFEQDPEVLSREMARFSRAHGVARSFFRALSPQGQEVASSDLEFWPEIHTWPIPMEALEREGIVWETATFNRNQARLIYFQYPQGLILQFGYDLKETHQALARSRMLLVSGLTMVLFFGALLSWVNTHSALRGIRQVSGAAALIRESAELDYRVPAHTGSSDTDRLADTFNSMLERIKSLVVNLQYMMDNIAHDIRTPVTRMRGIAEAELRKPDCASEEISGHVIEECDLILNLVNTLLDITSAESGLMTWEVAPLDLVELVREGCDLFQPVLENRRLNLELDLPECVEIFSDGRTLQRVVSNLVDNAVKYTPEGGTIFVTVKELNNGVELTVRDTGIGIPADEVEMVFHRFHRTDRSRSLPGNGLGLSFCQAALRCLDSDIICRSTQGEGACFIVRLPIKPVNISGSLR